MKIINILRDALLVDFEGASSMITETNETLNVSSNQLLTQHDRILEGVLFCFN